MNSERIPLLRPQEFPYSDLKDVRATCSCSCAYCTAQAICLKVMPSQASRIPVRCEENRRLPTPLPTLDRKLFFFFFSFANVSTNNVCPFPALKQSATDEINGFPGKPYFMSYKSNVSLYPFSLSVLNSGSKLGSKKT